MMMLFLFLFTTCVLIADYSKFEELRPLEDHLQDIVKKYDFKAYKSSVSEPIESAESKEYPLSFEFTFIGLENVLPFINEMENFQSNDAAFRIFALFISQTPESRASDGRPLFFVSILAKLIKCRNPGTLPAFHSNIVQAILKNAPSDPGARRGQKIAGTDLWVTNIRLDADFKVSLKGHSFKLNKIFELIRSMADSDPKKEVVINSLVSATYANLPSYRFEISTAESKTKPLPGHAYSIFNEIDRVVSASNGRISSLRIAPAIQLENKLGMPVEMCFENLTSEEWKQLKTALLAIAIEKIQIAGSSDKGLTDKGFTLRLKLIVLP